MAQAAESARPAGRGPLAEVIASRGGQAAPEAPFVIFPRGLAPRFYDTLVGICRGAGFEPKLLNESFHTAWQLGVLADVPAVAIAPESVARELPEGLVAVSLSEPTARVETALVWRAENQSATCAAFRAVARGVFEPQLLDTSLGEA